MAKTSGGTKKKGPKGKKARAKAKLERQWGEHVDPREQKSRIRRGRSRLVNSGDSARPQVVPAAAEPPSRNDTKEQLDSDDDEDHLDSGDAFSLLLQSISKKTKKSRNVSVDHDQAIDDDDDDDDDADGHDDDDQVEEEDDEDEVENYDEDDDNDNLIIPSMDPKEDHFEQSTEDPFTFHFSKEVLPEDSSDLHAALQRSQVVVKVTTPTLNDSLELQVSRHLLDRFGIQEYVSTLKSSDIYNKLSASLFCYNRKVLKQHWKRLNKTALKANADGGVPNTSEPFMTNLQSVLYPSLASYSDMLLCGETPKNRTALTNLVCLHILNHVLTTRGRIERNNKRVREIEENDGEPIAESIRDQGYTRATVLMLLPTRGVCLSIVKNMLSLLGDSSVVENMDRFEAEYGPPEEDELKESPELAQRRRKVQESKGREWNNLFGDNVNSDDDFKLGISFFPKASKDTGTGSKSAVSVRLYTDFYKSDIILASPLALKIATESEEDKQDDTDFLSSIEICFLGYSDVILMQNWEHVNDVLGLLNQQPKGSNDTDFSRVREYLLAGQARYWRQLIFYSNLIDPSFLSTFKRHASCIEGIVRLRRRVYNNEAALVKVIVATKQIFQRVSCDSFSTQGDERLKYFQKKVLPQIQEGKRSFTMIYVPSYFEFISLRNLFLKKEMNFVSVTEYARVSEVSRGRARFLQGRKPIMLYTGRAHFFGRHLIKGAKHLIVYGLPEHAEFYSDVVNMLNLGHEGNDEQMGSSCLVLFTKYEAHSLERICGKQNCERMLKGEKSTFMFVS